MTLSLVGLIGDGIWNGGTSMGLPLPDIIYDLWHHLRVARKQALCVHKFATTLGSLLPYQCLLITINIKSPESIAVVVEFLKRSFPPRDLTRMVCARYSYAMTIMQTNYKCSV